MQKLTVVGIGKLGLCNALIFEKAGYDVVGVDISESYCDALNLKNYESDEPYVTDYLRSAINFRATTSLTDGLAHSDLIFIVVDTPNGNDENHYDHSKLSGLLETINQLQVKDKDLIICCTVMPGYLDGEARKLVRDCEGVTLSYNPEFIAQGEVIHTFENPDMVLIGEANSEVGDRLQEVYTNTCTNQPYFSRVPVLEAEITKIAVNGFITTKLSYANMIGDLCERIGADKHQVLSAVGKDSRIGSKYLKPGLSFGGPCFPRDTRALSKVIRKYGIEPLLPDAAGQYNELHNEYMVGAMLKSGEDVYLFDDVSFKENCAVPITEESAKLKMAEILVTKYDKKVVIRDRKKVIEQVKKEYGEIFEYQIAEEIEAVSS